jgi:excisionase family DNA binding protein
VKAEFTIPPDFVDAVAAAVADRLRPMLKGLTAPPAKADDLMSLEELAAHLGGVSKDWVYQRTAKNEIPFVKVGRLVKFRRSDIDRWLSCRSVPAVAPLSAPLPGGKPRDCESRGTGKTHCVIAKV